MLRITGFVASGFFSTDNCRVTLKEILENPKLAHELHVRFRYDKSGRNFTIRKFARGKGLLCPIDAAISILLRAAALNVPPGHPIGVHHNPRSKAASKVVLLQSSEVIKIMREVCLEAYPDKRHYYHIKKYQNRTIMGLPLFCGSAHKVTPIQCCFQWDVGSAQAMFFHNISHPLILVSLTVASGIVAFTIRVHAA